MHRLMARHILFETRSRSEGVPNAGVRCNRMAARGATSDEVGNNNVATHLVLETH